MPTVLTTGGTGAGDGPAALAIDGDRPRSRRAQLSAARLYLVCDAQPSRRALQDLLRGAIGGGVDIVQLRDKLLNEAELVDAAACALEVCRSLGTLLVVNDNPAAALAVGADGVHVGQRDMPLAEVRAIVGADMLVGLSTHTPAEIDAAAGADYVGVGPVFATPTKPGRPAVGVELVRYAAQCSPLPFFAIGGIDAGNVAAVCQAGGGRVAVVRAIAHAQDPEAAARSIRVHLDGSPQGATGHTVATA